MKFTMLFLVLLAGCAKPVAPTPKAETLYVGEDLGKWAPIDCPEGAPVCGHLIELHTNGGSSVFSVIPKPKIRKRRRNEFRVRDAHTFTGKPYSSGTSTRGGPMAMKFIKSAANGPSVFNGSFSKEDGGTTDPSPYQQPLDVTLAHYGFCTDGSAVPASVPESESQSERLQFCKPHLRCIAGGALCGGNGEMERPTVFSRHTPPPLPDGPMTRLYPEGRITPGGAPPDLRPDYLFSAPNVHSLPGNNSIKAYCNRVEINLSVHGGYYMTCTQAAQ